MLCRYFIILHDCNECVIVTESPISWVWTIRKVPPNLNPLLCYRVFGIYSFLPALLTNTNNHLLRTAAHNIWTARTHTLILPKPNSLKSDHLQFPEHKKSYRDSDGDLILYSETYFTKLKTSEIIFCYCQSLHRWLTRYRHLSVRTRLKFL